MTGSILKQLALFATLTLAVALLPGVYHECFMPSENGNTVVEWRVIDSPSVPFAWGWSGFETWLVEEGSSIEFEITSVSPEIDGNLTIGNLTVQANNTRIAMELVLGVWGSTPFFPGLIIPIDSESLQRLNETAQEAAARKSGNYMNGSMEVSIEQVAASNGTYQCVVFDYVQDPVSFGDPQVTELAYDLETGVLVFCNTSYSFGTPYILTLELSAIAEPPNPAPLGLLITIVGLGGAGAVAVIIVSATRIAKT
ncbi:hypothetical protein EU545_01535 [Candidatus Thorarchaeota archaeon]|nr:MAG: hypothetical protein EU545_01535 [Candidatus Thorarchaeota archaeon]